MVSPVLHQGGSFNPDSWEGYRANRTQVLEHIERNEIDNVVKLIDVIKTERRFYLAFEYCSGGDLAQYIKKKGKLSESQAQRFMGQIANGLKYLRINKIVH